MRPKNAYDLIGDLHGEAEMLKGLLALLGYRRKGHSYRHPKGRKVMFLGDFLDRGPAVREVLHLARGMIEAGDALAVMGNHEYNALGYHMPDGRGGWLRPHNEKNARQLRRSLEDFAGREEEWAEWLKWFKSLPLFLDLGNLRVAHACWHEGALDVLGRNPRFDDSLMVANGAPWSPRMEAVGVLLKGPEMLLSGGACVADREGHLRKDFRVKWWADPRARSYVEIALPMPLDLPNEPFPEGERAKVCGYSEDAPPMFFGHYGFKKEPALMKPNLACVDFGVASGGPLGAYRWDGERILDPAKFILLPNSKSKGKP